MNMQVSDFELANPAWSKHYRVIASKFPTRNLFDEDEEDNYLLGELASETNDRLARFRDYVAPEDVRFGDGWGPVMASFCHPQLGRFSTDDTGAYYCSDDPHTAISEWSHHMSRFWQQMGFTEDASIVARCYTGNFKQPLLDVRGHPALNADDPSYSYTVSSNFAKRAGLESVYGILYQSVRRAGGECAALLRPPATTPVKQAGHYVCLYRDGEFRDYAAVGDIRPI